MVRIMAVTPFHWEGEPIVETNASREMPRLLDGVSGRGLEDQEELSCNWCFKKSAEIFQVTGNYCLRCWQQETHPNV
jgi:hypothetical protein